MTLLLSSKCYLCIGIVILNIVLGLNLVKATPYLIVAHEKSEKTVENLTPLRLKRDVTIARPEIKIKAPGQPVITRVSFQIILLVCIGWTIGQTPLEFVFQEQSYSSLHSGRSLAWDHVREDIDDPCGAIADFCGVIADPWGDWQQSIVAWLAKHHKTLLNIVKHHKTHVKHCDTS